MYNTYALDNLYSVEQFWCELLFWRHTNTIIIFEKHLPLKKFSFDLNERYHKHQRTDLILKIISQCDAKHIMTLLIKTIT
jgi:hypothetical protein